MRQQEGRIHDAIKSYTHQMSNQPHHWMRKIIISQSFFHRKESSEPHIRLPSLWGLESGGWAPRVSGFEGQQGLTAGTPQDWGKEKLHPWRVHTRSHAQWDPGKKQWLHRTLVQTYLLVLMVSWWGTVQLWLTVRTKTLVADILGSTHWHELSQRPSFWHQDLAPTQYTVGSSARTPQAKQPTGQEHSPTHQQTGSLKSSWGQSHLVNG